MKRKRPRKRLREIHTTKGGKEEKVRRKRLRDKDGNN